MAAAKNESIARTRGRDLTREVSGGRRRYRLSGRAVTLDRATCRVFATGYTVLFPRDADSEIDILTTAGPSSMSRKSKSILNSPARLVDYDFTST